ncbi:unnamed protein product [Angiostrongylus costaricensis]|uniref:Uncharacterized protein n=1 Tax=Angiostrongylus costaricensis TaxID=334426 RepID=A0A0R3Q009_ANGCS|nr:unnamed protein product [Angiostrongylus costaricensis]
MNVTVGTDDGGIDGAIDGRIAKFEDRDCTVEEGIGREVEGQGRGTAKAYYALTNPTASHSSDLIAWKRNHVNKHLFVNSF